MINLTDILHAHNRIRPYLAPTPLEAAPELGPNIYLKLENLNRTRSFKVRGALNAMLNLGDEDKARGIVACSAGNHAQGVAYAAQMAKVHAKVVMPAHTPRRKVNGARSFGAEILLHGESYDDAEIQARKMESQIGMTFISPYNDAQVVAGQGTVGLELFDVLPDLQRVIVPTSGGGLLGGIGLVCKTFNPECEVIGVQAEATPAMYNFFYDKTLPQQPTLAEGLSGEIEDRSVTLDLCKKYADKLLLVNEDDIAEAIRWTLKYHNWAIEGSAAVSVAALLTGQVAPDDRKTAVIISGGNIDYETLRTLLM